MPKGKMGPPSQFPYSLEETEKRFEQYKKEVEDNKVLFPCIQNFFVRNDILMEEANNTVNNPVDKNKDLAKYLKKIIDWHFDQLFTHPNWLKKSISAIYLSKQKVCGFSYTDKTEVKQDTKTEISVKFGSKSKNPFA